jgi:hypothetical protein
MCAYHGLAISSPPTSYFPSISLCPPFLNPPQRTCTFSASGEVWVGNGWKEGEVVGVKGLNITSSIQ